MVQPKKRINPQIINKKKAKRKKKVTAKYQNTYKNSTKKRKNKKGKDRSKLKLKSVHPAQNEWDPQSVLSY
jgi:hypothetical protein